MSRQKLLFLSPVVPALTGNGLAMRAGAVLRALAREHRVTLVVTPLYPPYAGAPPAEFAAACRRVAVVERRSRSALSLGWTVLARLLGLGAVRGGGSGASIPATLPFLGEHFEIVHVFRLAMVDVARRYVQAFQEGVGPELHLDLDDIESHALRGVAALHRASGREAEADRAEAAAERAAALEDHALGWCDRVYVCSEADRARLATRARAQVCLLPNTVSPAPIRPRPCRPGPFRFLFVGTLGYAPNADAVRFFCAEVVPRLELLAPRDFEVTIVGGGAGPLRRWIRSSRVTFAGYVTDLAAHYHAADAAVVPVRAGGGTRIKALEAFSYGRAVVATSAGLTGIDARHEEHALIGDSPDELARCCARLMSDTGLADRLAAAALDLVASRYSPDSLAGALAAAPPFPGRGGSLPLGRAAPGGAAS